MKRCKHLIEYSQQVPAPFGPGTVSEPLGDCAIKSESEDCSQECPDYEEEILEAKMTYSSVQKFDRRLQQKREHRHAVQARYTQMLCGRLEREGPGVVDPIANAIFRDTQRAINRFNKTNKDGHYD